MKRITKKKIVNYMIKSVITTTFIFVLPVIFYNLIKYGNIAGELNKSSNPISITFLVVVVFVFTLIVLVISTLIVVIGALIINILIDIYKWSKDLSDTKSLVQYILEEEFDEAENKEGKL